MTQIYPQQNLWCATFHLTHYFVDYDLPCKGNGRFIYLFACHTEGQMCKVHTHTRNVYKNTYFKKKLVSCAWLKVLLSSKSVWPCVDWICLQNHIHTIFHAMSGATYLCVCVCSVKTEQKLIFKKNFVFLHVDVIQYTFVYSKWKRKDGGFPDDGWWQCSSSERDSARWEQIWTD